MLLIVKGLIWAGSIAIAGLMVFGFFGAHSPLADSVSHFRYHQVVALIAAAGVLLMFRARKSAGATILIIVVGLVGLYPAIPGLQTASALGHTNLKLLQLNVFYWNNDLERILELVRMENPDAITLQEISPDNEALLKRLAADYPTLVTCRVNEIEMIAVVTRLAPVGRTNRGCVDGMGLTWIRVKTADQPVTLASIHLTWPYPYDQKEHIEHIKPFIGTLPGPVVMSGDFNAAPWSHAVRQVAREFDGIVAPGLRPTFRIRNTPFLAWTALPIDHVLVSRELTVREIKMGPHVGSDHRPLIADILVLSSP